MVEQAENSIARFFGGSRTIFYYDGGVANGLSVLSMGRLAREKGRNGIICSPVEHSSVLSALRILSSEGSSVILLELFKLCLRWLFSIVQEVDHFFWLFGDKLLNRLSSIKKPLCGMHRRSGTIPHWIASQACIKAFFCYGKKHILLFLLSRTSLW